MVRNRALEGDPAVTAGRGMLEGMLSGDYYNSPAFAHAYNRGADLVQGRTGAMFGAQGLSNSGVQQQTARDLNDLAMGLINQEQARMPAYAGLALEYGNEPYRAAQAMMGIGDVQREFDQAAINQAMQKYYEKQQIPFRQLDVAKQGILTGFGGGQSITQTGPGYFQPSRTAGLLGGAAAGYGLGGMLAPQSQYAPFVGGALGGLAGMYV